MVELGFNPYQHNLIALSSIKKLTRFA